MFLVVDDYSHSSPKTPHKHPLHKVNGPARIETKELNPQPHGEMEAIASRVPLV